MAFIARRQTRIYQAIARVLSALPLIPLLPLLLVLVACSPVDPPHSDPAPSGHPSLDEVPGVPAPDPDGNGLLTRQVISGEFTMDTPVYGPIKRDQSTPAASFDGTNYMIVWSDARRESDYIATYNLYATRMTPQGQVLDPAGIRLTSDQGFDENPGIAFDGTNHLVAWKEQKSGTVKAMRIDKAGKTLDGSGVTIATAAPAGLNGPGVAYGGGVYAIVWLDNTSVWLATFSPSTAAVSTYQLTGSAVKLANDAPAISWGANSFLVVWSKSGTALAGVRVSTTGQIIGSEFTVASAAYGLSAPSAASDGTNWLVAWQGSPNGGSNLQIEAIRVSSMGAPQGGIFTASHSTSSEFRPEVVFSGTSYLLVWGDWRNDPTTGDDVYAVRVSTSGTVIDAADIKICDAAGNQGSQNNAYRDIGLACSTAAGTCMAAWRDNRGADSDIYGTPLNSSGVPPDTSGVLVSTGANVQQNPAAATDGTNYLVVWEDLRNAGGVATQTDIYGVLLNAMGKPVDAAGIMLTAQAEEQKDVAVAWNGQTYFVAWTDKRNYASAGYDIYGARVSAAGVVLDPGGKLVSGALGDQITPAVASNGTGFFVVWSDRRQQQPRIVGTRIDASGSVVDTDGIVIGVEHEQRSPHVASDGTGYFVVWDDYQPISPNNRIHGVRLDGQGQKIDAVPLWISASETSARSARAAWDGKGYVVVWNGPTYEAAARVSSDGLLVDNPSVVLGAAKNQLETPGVAWDGFNVFVSWDVQKGPSLDWDIAATRLSTNGKVFDKPEVFLANDVSDEREVAAISAGEGLSLVVYARNIVAAPLGVKRIAGRFVRLGDDIASTCAADADCNSGVCVDGVCCDTPCGGGDSSDCQSCALEGAVGTCTPIVVGPCSSSGSGAAGGGVGGMGGSGNGGMGAMGGSGGSSAGDGAAGGSSEPHGGAMTSQFACGVGHSTPERGLPMFFALIAASLLVRRKH